jgi:molybdate transport system substrate-binding protein
VRAFPLRPPVRFPLPRLRAAALIATFALAPAACERGREEPAPAGTVLTVSAAASLREVVTELGEGFEKAHPGVEVRANFGASGALRQQIEHGAPVDVFLSAAEGPMDELERAGLIEPRTRRPVAGNELVLVVPASGDSPARSFADLARPEVRRVALGAPASVPAGDYADQVLRALGIADAVRAKAVYAQSVRQVLAYVESGNVDAGVVYRTDARVSRRVRAAAAAPAGSHAPITYSAAVVARTERPEAAQAFVGFLLGGQGRAALSRHGFVVR